MNLGVRTSHNTGVGFGPITSLFLLFFYLVFWMLRLAAWLIMLIAGTIICGAIWLYGEWENRQAKKKADNEPKVWRKGY